MSTTHHPKPNGTLIRKRRLDYGWDQQQLAGNCKLAQRTIQRAEAGASVSRDTASQIAAALGLAVSQIFDEPANDAPWDEPTVVLWPTSAREVVDCLLRANEKKLECEADPTPEAVEPLIALAEELESLTLLGQGFAWRVKKTARVASLMSKLATQGIRVFCGEYMAVTSRQVWAEEVGIYREYDRVAVVVISTNSAAKVSRVVYDKRSDEADALRGE